MVISRKFLILHFWQLFWRHYPTLHKCNFNIEKFFLFFSLIWNSAILLLTDWRSIVPNEKIFHRQEHSEYTSRCWWCFFFLSWFKERRKWRNNGNTEKRIKKKGEKKQQREVKKKKNGKWYMWSLFISSHNKCQLIYRETTNNKYTIKVFPVKTPLCRLAFIPFDEWWTDIVNDSQARSLSFFEGLCCLNSGYK